MSQIALPPTTTATRATIDRASNIAIDCDEPHCRYFESGHESDGIIHERPESHGVTVSRTARDALWDLELNVQHIHTVAEAEKLIEVLTAAVAEANALNALGSK